MIWMRLLPGVLKELSKHVPTILFEVVDWSELTAELPKVSRRLMHNREYFSLIENQKGFLSAHGIDITSEKVGHREIVLPKWAAEKLLFTFFAQLWSPYGLFLDLRTHGMQPEGSVLHWKPNGLFTQFEKQFQQGLIQIYEGFYLEDEQLLLEGLVTTNLIEDSWASEDKHHLAMLFKKQFGNSLEGEMVFDLEQFRDSIIKTTEFLLKKKVRITKDFLYLGIYLVTLYSSLENSGEAIAVKDIFLKAREAFGKSK